MVRIPKLVICAAVFALAPATPRRAAAEVQSVAANGFEIRESAHMSGSPDKVFAALLLPAQWWSSDHTFSRNAANLVLDARAGGCW